MKATRYMNFCERARLHSFGVINAKTAPFAVIGVDEELKDTAPTPPVGAVMLYPEQWRLPGWCYQFGAWKLEFEVPDAAVVWRGVGTYRTKDYFSEKWRTERLEEIAVRELRAEWILHEEVPFLDILSHLEPGEAEFWAETIEAQDLHCFHAECARPGAAHHEECLRFAQALLRGRQ
jgi:hypothetical protein